MMVSTKLIAALQITPEQAGLPKVDANAQTIANVIGTVFLVIGAMSVFYLLLAAIRYITSNGDQQQITQAKQSIIYGVAGLVISLMAFGIVQFILGRLSGTL